MITALIVFMEINLSNRKEESLLYKLIGFHPDKYFL